MSQFSSDSTSLLSFSSGDFFSPIESTKASAGADFSLCAVATHREPRGMMQFFFNAQVNGLRPLRVRAAS
jgi:hypothetical protein